MTAWHGRPAGQGTGRAGRKGRHCDVSIYLNTTITPFAMKNHESFMNLVEQVSSSGGDDTWSDVLDRQDIQSSIRRRVVSAEEELKEDTQSSLREKNATNRRKEHWGVTIGCISVFISMVITFLNA